MTRCLIATLTVAAVLLGAAHGAAGAVRDGQIVFRSNRDDGKADLYLMNRDGSGVHRLTYLQTPVRTTAWSRDGTKVAFAANVHGSFDIFTVNADGSGLTRVTSDPSFEDSPRWTSDGRIVFQRGFGCPCSIWIANADGTGVAQLPTGAGNAITPDAAPGGRMIVFGRDLGAGLELWTMQPNGTGLRKLTHAVPPASNDFRPRFSPTGTEIVFARDVGAGDNDLFVVRIDGHGLRRLTDTPNRAEESPSWSPSGDEIVFAGFSVDGSSPARLYAISADGSGETQLSTAYAAPLLETFDDGYRDGSLWHRISDPGSSIAEANGRLEIAIAAGSTPGGPFNQIDAHYGSQCVLPWDYAMQVDFTLLDWPELGFYTALRAFFANAGMSRQASPWGQLAVGWSGELGNGVPSAITSGSFRLVRVGGVVNAYVRSTGDTDWALVFSGPEVTGDAVYGLGLTAPGDWYTGAAASVAFDNFQLLSGALTCPSWWADAFPDWGSG